MEGLKTKNVDSLRWDAWAIDPVLNDQDIRLANVAINLSQKVKQGQISWSSLPNKIYTSIRH